MRRTRFRESPALLLGAFLSMTLAAVGLVVVYTPQELAAGSTVTVLCALAVAVVVGASSVLVWCNRDRAIEAEDRAQAAEDRLKELDREMTKLRPLVASFEEFKALYEQERDRRAAARGEGSFVGLLLDQSSRRN